MKRIVAVLGMLVIGVSTTRGQGTATTPTSMPRADANGNPLRVATRTGHISNYDEAKVKPYTLPDPLVMSDGKPVKDADTWYKLRRPEILKLYEAEIYGRVPANAPKVSWQVAATNEALNGAAVQKRIEGRVGDKADGPVIRVTLDVPANARGPVPVILCLNFGAIGGGGAARGRGSATATATASAPATTRGGGAAAGGAGGAGGARGRGPGLGGDPVAEILARGWAYASVNYTDIQPDQANTFTRGVIGLTLAPGQTAPAPDEWGTISAWAWGLSRIVDYFATDQSIDAKQVAIMGHSRLGKTVLWAGAQDSRIAVVFSSCGGELGSALARRDWGETVDDMAQNYGYQFAGNLQKYPGKWNEMPVDAHMLIALCAPRPVYITGGTTDQWSDPKGEFLAEVAAGPVYRLLGAKDLGVTELPALDVPVIAGELGYHYHTGGHMATPTDWRAFLEFAGKHFK